MEENEKLSHPRKLEIVDAAVTCFIEQGYHQTGVRDIAQKANISLGNLYNHFKGKEAVLAFIAEMECQELQEFTAILSRENKDPLSRLRHFIKAYTAYSERAENALLGIEVFSEALRNTSIAAIFEKNRDVLVGALAECLKAGKAEGVFTSLGDEKIDACMILDVIEGHGLRTTLGSKSSRKTKKALENFILGGLRSV